MALKKRSHSAATRKKISQSLKAHHARKKKGKYSKSNHVTEGPAHAIRSPGLVRRKVQRLWAVQKEHDRRGNKNKVATARKVKNARKAFTVALKATKKPKKKR